MTDYRERYKNEIKQIRDAVKEKKEGRLFGRNIISSAASWQHYIERRKLDGMTDEQIDAHIDYELYICDRNQKLSETRRTKRTQTTKAVVQTKTKKQKIQDEKFGAALAAGARVTELSLSKTHWEVGRGIEIAKGVLDYQVHWVLAAAADKIFRKHSKWFAEFLKIDEEGRREPKKYVISLSEHEIKEFLNRSDIKSKELFDAVMRIPELSLIGKIKLPSVLVRSGWSEIALYKDNLCGIAVASKTTFPQYLYGQKKRGRGAGEIENVFVFIFSNEFGKNFFRNAMSRKGVKLLPDRLFKLKPKAQELFFIMFWNNGLIMFNTEQISKKLGLEWPVKDLYSRVQYIEDLLNILYYDGLINKPHPQGKTIETRSWTVVIKKKYLNPKKLPKTYHWPLQLLQIL